MNVVRFYDHIINKITNKQLLDEVFVINMENYQCQGKSNQSSQKKDISSKEDHKLNQIIVFS